MLRRRVRGSEGVESSSMRVGPNVGRDGSFGVGVGNSSLERTKGAQSASKAHQRVERLTESSKTHPIQLLTLPSPTSKRLPSNILPRNSSTHDPNRSDGDICVDQRPRETENREESSVWTGYGFGVERVQEVGVGLEELWAKEGRERIRVRAHGERALTGRKEGRTDGLLQGSIAA